MITNNAVAEFSNADQVLLYSESVLTTPTPVQIRRECESIQKDWNVRERTLRRIRSQMAIRFGICRNL